MEEECDCLFELQIRFANGHANIKTEERFNST